MAKPVEPERHSLKGWGARYADWDQPITLDEAQALAQFAMMDRLLDCVTHLEDITLRLAHIERWLSETAPGYRAANASSSTPVLPGVRFS